MVELYLQSLIRAVLPRFDSRQVQEIFLFSAPPAVSLRVKRPGREADHSPVSSTEVKNGGSIPPLPHTFSLRGAQLSTRKTLPLSVVIHTKVTTACSDRIDHAEVVYNSLIKTLF
jgi:hypothetical protein